MSPLKKRNNYIKNNLIFIQIISSRQVRGRRELARRCLLPRETFRLRRLRPPHEEGQGHKSWNRMRLKDLKHSVRDDLPQDT